MKNTLNVLLFLLIGTLVYDNCEALSKHAIECIRENKKKEILLYKKNVEQEDARKEVERLNLELEKIKKQRQEEVKRKLKEERVAEKKYYGKVIQSWEDLKLESSPWRGDDILYVVLSVDALNVLKLDKNQLESINRHLDQCGENCRYAFNHFWNEIVNDNKFPPCNNLLAIEKNVIEELLTKY